MSGVKYCLMVTAEVSKLVMVNPIGLEDWKAKGVTDLKKVRVEIGRAHV